MSRQVIGGSRQTDAFELRRLAEAADGQRKKDLAIVRNELGHLDLIPEDQAKEDEIVLLVRTNSREKQRDPLNVEISRASFARSKNLGTEYDAIFWSASAIGKFAIPYYCSINDSPEAHEKLLAAFEKNADAVCIVHSPPTTYSIFKVGMLSRTENAMLDGGIEFVTVDEFLSRTPRDEA